MYAIFKRELNSYFTSVIGYIVIAGLFFIAGSGFSQFSMSFGLSDMRYQFSSMLQLIMILIPLLTMRLFSEDKKQKTDQALLTAPISLFSLVFGKFLAALMIFTIGLSITLVQALVLGAFAQLEWAVIFGNYIGLLLIGASFIAIGTFVSVLTENQFIAAVGGFAIIGAFMYIDVTAKDIENPIISKIVNGISFFGKYEDFYKGIFNIANTVFFISVCAVFIFLTVRALEKRRWS